MLFDTFLAHQMNDRQKVPDFSTIFVRLHSFQPGSPVAKRCQANGMLLAINPLRQATRFPTLYMLLA